MAKTELTLEIHGLEELKQAISSAHANAAELGMTEIPERAKQLLDLGFVTYPILKRLAPLGSKRKEGVRRYLRSQKLPCYDGELGPYTTLEAMSGGKKVAHGKGEESLQRWLDATAKGAREP